MLRWFRSQLSKEEGFTLVELMVVVLIIAILIAIAIPTFLGARQRAQDRAAQSDLRNALTAAKVYYTDAEDYGHTEAQLEAIEPSIDFIAMAGATSALVGFTGAAQVVTFTKQSTSLTWFCISDNAAAGGGTSYGSGVALANVDTAAECILPAW